MTFLEALREQVEVKKSKRGRLLLRRLDSMTPARRKRVVARLEKHATTFVVAEGVKAGPAGAIDWSSIDWAKLFESLLKLLMLLLPLFI